MIEPSPTKLRVVACPICGSAVEWTSASRWRPFCSERCKTIDLGAWATERYSVPVTEAPDDDQTAGARDDERGGRSAAS